MTDHTGVIYNLSRAFACSPWRPPWRGPRTPWWHDFIEKSEADLGMFSMFGRTGAPRKGQFFSFFCFRKAGLKLPVSCCCNSSVHCCTGRQQNVDDDYCVCRMKAAGGGVTGYSYIRGPHFFVTGSPLGVNPAL